MEKISGEPDMEWLMIDVTHIHVHAQAAGAGRMIVTSGNRNDITQVEKLTQGFHASYLLADKG